MKQTQPVDAKFINFKIEINQNEYQSSEQSMYQNFSSKNKINSLLIEQFAKS